jgi:uncharacterized protein
MTKDSLPLKVDPFRFADNHHHLQGVLSTKKMLRLPASSTDVDPTINVSLKFGVDEERIHFVQGHIETALILQCQRCMELFSFPLECDFAAGFVSSERQADKLPERYDPIIVKDNELFLTDMVEEELLVSLPIVPMHSRQDCKAVLTTACLSDDLVDEIPVESPFKAIEILRSKGNI